MSRLLLTLNAGSSSIKFALYEVVDGAPVPSTKGRVEGIGTAPHFIAKTTEGAILSESYWEPVSGSQGHDRAFEQIWSWIANTGAGKEILAIGHRVVHGGEAYSQPVRINASVIETLTRLIPLVPLHQPHNLAAIKAVASHHQELPQVACFDTGFHQGRSAVTKRFGLPYQLFERGVRRYGFHGLSYEYIAGRLREVAPEVADRRVIVAHLGSGCSMTAICGGKSVETTMSFSALDGLPMGTRCGILDPGVLLYLMHEEGLGVRELEDLLYKRSGLLGLSGVSNDMRALHASDDPRATEAIDYFIYHIGRTLGSLAASLGGLDALVFTAGVGENDAEIRRRVCTDAAWLGIELDEAANRERSRRISPEGSTPSVWVIPTDEEKMIATHTLGVLQSH